MFVSGQLMEITEKIESNPGKLNCYVHLPKNKLTKNLPLVIVLHGCSQTAQDIYKDAGWEKLSDSLGFIVLLPEQRFVNNGGRCFQWYKPENQTEKGSEIQSISSMLYYVNKTYHNDSSKQYIYGVSAGAVMAVNCIFLYPEKFDGSAIVAGECFGTTDSYSATFKSIIKAKELPDSLLLNSKTRKAQLAKTFPRTVVFHGDKDKIVDPIHGKNLVTQINLVRGLTETDTLSLNRNNFKHPIRQISYSNPATGDQVQYYIVHNWGHYLMVDPGNKQNQGGSKSSLSRDGDFWSTLYIVNFWFETK